MGEDNFSLLFHKGINENIHYTKIGNDFFLITLFAKDVSLGLMRLKTAKVKEPSAPRAERRRSDRVVSSTSPAARFTSKSSTTARDGEGKRPTSSTSTRS